MSMVEKADGNGWGMRCRVKVKRQKARLERRKARRNPECIAGYGKYSGYLT